MVRSKANTTITVQSLLKLYNGSHIDNDMIIIENFNSKTIEQFPKKMGCLFLGLILKGSASYTVDTVNHNVVANDLMIVSEGQTISNYTTSSDCSGIAFAVSQQFFNEIVRDLSELNSLFLFSRTNPVCSLSNEEVETLLTYCNFIKQKTNNTSHHFRKDIVRSLFSAMIYDISNSLYRIEQLRKNEHSGTRAETIFSEFLKLVETNMRKERQVNWYAKQLNITPKYLSESVKSVSKRTPNDWIDNYLTIAIRVMLRNTNKTIKEITKDMGFPNQSFLGTFFKEHVGMSPREYRRGKEE